MRQVGRDELIWALAMAARHVTPTQRKQWATGTYEQQTRARAAIAGILADGLARFEIMTDTPLPGLMGEETYARPLARMLGDDLPSGVATGD